MFHYSCLKWTGKAVLLDCGIFEVSSLIYEPVHDKAFNKIFANRKD